MAIVKVFAADTAGEPEWTTTGGQTMRAADFALGDWAVITSWDNLVEPPVDEDGDPLDTYWCWARTGMSSHAKTGLARQLTRRWP